MDANRSRPVVSIFYTSQEEYRSAPPRRNCSGHHHFPRYLDEEQSTHCTCCTAPYPELLESKGQKSSKSFSAPVQTIIKPVRRIHSRPPDGDKPQPGISLSPKMCIGWLRLCDQHIDVDFMYRLAESPPLYLGAHRTDHNCWNTVSGARKGLSVCRSAVAKSLRGIERMMRATRIRHGSATTHWVREGLNTM